MKDVYFASDSYALTGPSIVNKYYRELLQDSFTFAQQETNRFKRLCKAVKYISKHKVIIFSGASKFDYFLICLAKVFRRKIIYIMHGCIQEENKINKVERADETQLERFYLQSVDLILCVSEQFTQWVKGYYPMYQEKIFPLTNGVDWEIVSGLASNIRKNPKAISIIGGGVPRKNVKSVCTAIAKLITESGEEYQLKVFGRDDLDTEVIKSYPFVKYYGKIQRDRLFEEIAETCLFVQNSIFDSFAMAPLEALLCGCSILCSKNVGALSLFRTIEASDCVEDCFDAEEIKEKIAYLLRYPNHERLLDSLDRRETSFAHRAEELRQYAMNLIEG